MYVDTESICEKIHTCSNNPNISSTEKINEHEMCGYTIFTECSFDKKNNKLDYYRGKDSFENFCKDLSKHAKSIIDFEKKELPILTEEEEFKYYMEDKCHTCQKKFYDRQIRKVRKNIILK